MAALSLPRLCGIAAILGILVLGFIYSIPEQQHLVRRAQDNTKSVLYLHAAGACIAWAVIMPIGAAVRKTTVMARFHAVIMSMALILATMAFAAGIVISARSKKRSSLTAPHQVLGLILFPLMILQFLAGALNHSIYKRSGKPTYIGTVHKYLGPAVLTAGILNGYIGIDFAEDNEYIMPYVVTVVVWLFLLFMGTTIIRRWGRRGMDGVSKGTDKMEVA